MASLNSFGCGDLRQPLAQRTIADLIVVLQEVDKGQRREVARRLAARLSAAIGGRLALIDETLGQRAPQPLDGRIGEVGIVAVPLAGEQDVHGVMQVVVPLRVEQPPAQFGSVPQEGRTVVIVLEHKMDVAADGGPHGTGELDQKMGLARIHDRVHGIEAEPVKPKLL